MPQTISISGKYPVKFFNRKGIAGRLSALDRKQFESIVTYSEEVPGKAGRSYLLKLENPITVCDANIKALRLKGVFPKVLPGTNEIKTYTEGPGVTLNRYHVDTQAQIVWTKIERERYDSAEGTMTAERLEREEAVALALGPKLTDIFLGSGTYINLAFRSNPVGFAVYGMETDYDERLLSLIAKVAQDGNNTFFDPEVRKFLRKLSQNAGFMLRKMHARYRTFHRVIHLNNVGVTIEGSIKIRDLDAAEIIRRKISHAEEVAWRYLDLAALFYRFFTPDVTTVDGKTILVAPLWDFLASAIQGYFHKERESAFASYAQQYLEKIKIETEKYQNFPFGRPLFEVNGIPLIKPEDSFISLPIEIRVIGTEKMAISDWLLDNRINPKGPLCHSFIDALRIAVQNDRKSKNLALQ